MTSFNLEMFSIFVTNSNVKNLKENIISIDIVRKDYVTATVLKWHFEMYNLEVN